jgi:hypothetical protein
MALTVTYSKTNIFSDFETNFHTTGSQWTPDVLGLTNGGFVSAYRNIDVDSFIALDFYDTASVHVGSTKIPHAGTAGAIGQPSLTQLANGNVLVVWDNNASDNAGLRGRLFTPTGGTIGAELDLQTSGKELTDPQVAALSDGGFLVTRTYNNGSNYSDPGVFRYNSSGQLVFATNLFGAATTDGNANLDTAVTALADGGYVVSYTSDYHANDQQGLDIAAQIFNADNSTRQATFYIDHADGDQSQSKVAALSNGRFVVAYTDASWPSEGGALHNSITLQLFSPSGARGSVVQVNTPSTVDESDPDVTVLSNGFILVTWTHPFSSTDRDIYGRVFDQDLNRSASTAVRASSSLRQAPTTTNSRQFRS